MARVPQVEQHVARSGVEAAHRRRSRGSSVTLAMPPRLTTTRSRAGSREQRRVEGRHQRRALPARGDVARAEIGDHGHVRALGDARGVVESGPSSLRAGDGAPSGRARRRRPLRAASTPAASHALAQRLRVEIGQRDSPRARRARSRRRPIALQREQLARAATSERRRASRPTSVHGAAPPAAKSATTASTPSRLVPDITPANDCRRAIVRARGSLRAAARMLARLLDRRPAPTPAARARGRATARAARSRHGRRRASVPATGSAVGRAIVSGSRGSSAMRNS